MFLNDWSKDGLFGMIANFEDVHMSLEEYNANESPWKNKDYWAETKLRAEAALNDEKYQRIEIILASYANESYSGEAFVLFRKDGKLYEVNGAHCSCYGLEGQWEPDETTWESLKHRVDHGSLGSSFYGENNFAQELRDIIERECPK